MLTEVLDEATWRARQHAHQDRVDGWLAGHRERAGRGVRHPVEDFLFDYYSHRPSQLRRWHPGVGVALAGPAPEHLDWPHYVRAGDGGAVTVDTAAVLTARRATVEWVRELLVRTAGRPGYFGCFGLHEWAMVYGLGATEVRHPDWPLRFSPERIRAVVEERGVRCAHYDAYRFFTPAARPLNVLRPTRTSQPDLEQPGCLHANMDLYKHAYKLSPLVPSELVADAFALARDLRVLDMRAGPYDLSALALEPVPIETAEGRATYASAQRELSSRAVPLRQALATLLDRVLADAPTTADSVPPTS